MRMRHQTNWLDRRRFLAGSTAALAGGTSVARAQTAPKESPRLSARIAEFATGFDLAKAPPLAIERARTAFVDTIGVTLAGSTEKVAEIVRDMVRGGRRGTGRLGNRRIVQNLAAARGAGQWRRLPRARFRFHLHAGPTHGAGDPGAVAARRGDRRDPCRG